MGIHHQLSEWGYDNILGYLAAACKVTLDEGLLPHPSPGGLTRETFADFVPLNASMGVMLGTTADVAAHSGSWRRAPGQWLNTIRVAGEVSIPFTTGIPVGIGETRRDRAGSLLAIRTPHKRYGHVQEVVVQNVVPNERSDYEYSSFDIMRRVMTMARVALPEEVSVQVPPNLLAAADLIVYGADDLGGVPLVVDDYANPDYEWPALRELTDIIDEAGVSFRERLPAYERFLPNGAFGPTDDSGESGGAPVAAPGRE